MTDFLKLQADCRNKETFSKLVLDSAFDGVFTKSPDGTITSWNTGAEKIYGYTEQEIAGKNVSILIPNNKSEELSDILKKINKGEKTERLETERVTKNGTLVELIISVIPILENDTIIGAAVFHKDISPQKIIERKYYELFDQASDAILIADLDAHFTDANSTACKMLGYSKKEILEKTILDLIPSEDAERLKQTKEFLIKHDKIQIAEWSLKKKDGNYLPVEVSAKILSDGRWQGFIRDISKQKDAERKYYELFEQASDAIFIANLSGQYTEINTSACKMLGYSRKELIGKTILDLIPSEERKRLREAKTRLLIPGEIEISEWNLKKKDGSYLPVEVSAKILPDGRWQAFVRDISKQKQDEKKFNFICESASSILTSVENLSETNELSIYAYNLIEASPDPFIITNLEGLIIDANKAALDILECKNRKLKGVALASIFTDPESVKENISKVIEIGQVKNIPLNALDFEGNSIDFLLSASVYKDHSKKTEGIFYIFKDISNLIKIAGMLISEEKRSSEQIIEFSPKAF